MGIKEEYNAQREAEKKAAAVAAKEAQEAEKRLAALRGKWEEQRKEELKASRQNLEKSGMLSQTGDLKRLGLKVEVSSDKTTITASKTQTCQGTRDYSSHGENCSGADSKPVKGLKMFMTDRVVIRGTPAGVEVSADHSAYDVMTRGEEKGTKADLGSSPIEYPKVHEANDRKGIETSVVQAARKVLRK